MIKSKENGIGEMTDTQTYRHSDKHTFDYIYTVKENIFAINSSVKERHVLLTLYFEFLKNLQL